MSVKLKILIYLIIMLLAFSTGHVVVAALMFLPIVWTFTKLCWQYAWYHITAPFHFLYGLFTNTLFGKNEVLYRRWGVNKIRWANKFQFVMFGIIGRGIYFALFYGLIFLILFYRPYNEGYVTKDLHYEAGDIVLTKHFDEKELATVESYSSDLENGVLVTVRTESGKIIETGLSGADKTNATTYVKGHYCTDTDNFIIRLLKSTFNGAKYTIQRIPRILYLIWNDFP